MRRLPIVTDGDSRASRNAETPRARHPPWIKARIPSGDTYFGLRDQVRALGLHTVCESASCPNIGECWNRRSLTIMILGGTCTRSCQFCDVPMGKPDPLDADEPRRVAEMLAGLDLEHTVITCVDRDDLPDFGAAHWAATLTAVRALCPAMTVEALVGDFQGRAELVDVVLAASPDVFAHNLETVPRLSREVRVQARFDRSLGILDHARARGAVTKTGLMLGLGETLDEVREVLVELGRMGVDIVTLGQYLRPSQGHLPIARYATPEEFAALREDALAAGVRHVESGPLVRSSYHADGQAALVRALRSRPATYP